MIVDLIILAIIILSIILGRHKGLTVCLVNFFSLMIALVVALMAYKPISNYLYEQTPIGENVKQVIKQNIPSTKCEWSKRWNDWKCINRTLKRNNKYYIIYNRIYSG